MMFLLTSRRESISGESGRALHTHWNLPWTNLLRTQRHSTLRTSCFSFSREFTARPREVLERIQPEFPPNRQAAPFSESSARLQTATKLEHFLRRTAFPLNARHGKRRFSWSRTGHGSSSHANRRVLASLSRSLSPIAKRRACDSRLAPTNRSLHTTILAPLPKPHLSHV